MDHFLRRRRLSTTTEMESGTSPIKNEKWSRWNTSPYFEYDGLNALAVSLRETDMAQIAVERDRLELEREGLVVGQEDRAREHALRRDDRDA